MWVKECWLQQEKKITSLGQRWFKRNKTHTGNKQGDRHFMKRISSFIWNQPWSKAKKKERRKGTAGTACCALALLLMASSMKCVCRGTCVWACASVHICVRYLLDEGKARNHGGTWLRIIYSLPPPYNNPCSKFQSSRSGENPQRAIFWQLFSHLNPPSSNLNNTVQTLARVPMFILEGV